MKTNEVTGIVKCGNLQENHAYKALKRWISQLLSHKDMRPLLHIQNEEIRVTDPGKSESFLKSAREKILANNPQADRWLPLPIGPRASIKMFGTVGFRNFIPYNTGKMLLIIRLNFWTLSHTKVPNSMMISI